MKNRTINIYLILTILALSIIPVLASILLLDEILDSTINMSWNQQASEYLRQYQNELKEFKVDHPEKEAIYKKRFFEVENLLRITSDPDTTVSLLQRTYLTYYLVLFLLVFFIALIAAVVLSRKVSRSYRVLMEAEKLKSRRIEELSYFDEWKEIAGKLAHEIKTPLTPIQVMVSDLTKVSKNIANQEFKNKLKETVEVVSEEIVKLREMVNHFSSFSKLPKPRFLEIDIVEYFKTYLQQYGGAWSHTNIELKMDHLEREGYIKLDSLLFNHCMGNLISNAIEANPEKEKVNITITLRMKHDNAVEIEVFNEGRSIPENEMGKIFKMYYSTKENSENMGLGLPIVKKIILDHGGDIRAWSVREGVGFNITLPVLKK